MAEDLNARLLRGDFDENKVKSELKRATHEELSKRSESFKRTSEAFSKVAFKQTKAEAIKQATLLGLHLRREISDGKFDAFIIVLVLSIFKDLTDVPSCAVSLCTAGSLLNFALTGILFIVFFLRKRSFKKWIFKKAFGRIIIAVIFEFIPGFNIFPTYTIGTIWIKLKADKRIKELKSQANAIDKDVEYLIKDLNRS